MTEPREEKLDYAERWLRDSLDVLRPAFAAYQVTVDMSHALARLDDLRGEGVSAGGAHVLVYAAARALAANADLHQLIAGRRRLRPDHVTIGLSVSGETFVTPVLLIERADRKELAEIARETAARVPAIQQADREKLDAMRRWGRLVPIAAVRRAILRRVFGKISQRRRLAGTFQVSTVPTEWGMTSAFLATGVLIGGLIQSGVVAVAGQPTVRPVARLTLVSDHGVWDGRASSRFLSAVRHEIECGLSGARGPD